MIPGQEGKKTDYYDCSKLNLEELCVVIHAKAYRRVKGRASEEGKTLNNEWIRNLMNLVRSENLRRDKDEFPRGRVDQVGDELV